jgi:transcriptional regulator with XRE-family HTH domain
MASKTSYPYQSHWRWRLTQLMHEEENNFSNQEVNVGLRLQQLRNMRGLSQRALAELSSLNFNTLSLIENEKTSPNVSTLQQLAEALDVPITAFFDTLSPKEEVVFQKAGERPKTDFPQGMIEDLGAGMALGDGTPLLMTLNPDSQSDPEVITHSGQEFVFCLEGKMIYWVDGIAYHMEPGDSLIFEANLPHRWENACNCVSRSILLICPSDQEDRSVMGHILKE